VEIRDIVPLDEREKGRTLWRPWRAHCEREERRRRSRARGEREEGRRLRRPWPTGRGTEYREKRERRRP